MINLLPNDYMRCNNNHCTQKEKCKRFQQHQLDKVNKMEGLRGVTPFPAEKCEKIIPLIK